MIVYATLPLLTTINAVTLAWAAPRISRWGTKQDSRAERAETKFVPPLFQMCGVHASKYQSGELKFSHLYSTA